MKQISGPAIFIGLVVIAFLVSISLLPPAWRLISKDTSPGSSACQSQMLMEQIKTNALLTKILAGQKGDGG